MNWHYARLWLLIGVLTAAAVFLMFLIVDGWEFTAYRDTNWKRPLW